MLAIARVDSKWFWLLTRILLADLAAEITDTVVDKAMIKYNGH